MINIYVLLYIQGELHSWWIRSRVNMLSRLYICTYVICSILLVCLVFAVEVYKATRLAINFRAPGIIGHLALECHGSVDRVHAVSYVHVQYTQDRNKNGGVSLYLLERAEARDIYYNALESR